VTPAVRALEAEACTFRPSTTLRVVPLPIRRMGGRRIRGSGPETDWGGRRDRKERLPAPWWRKRVDADEDTRPVPVRRDGGFVRLAMVDGF